MRTTIRMNDALRRQAQQLAESEGRTFTAVIEEAVTSLLAQRRVARHRKRVVLPTFKGQGLQPGVSLENNSALLDRLDEGLPLEKRR